MEDDVHNSEAVEEAPLRKMGKNSKLLSSPRVAVDVIAAKGYSTATQLMEAEATDRQAQAEERGQKIHILTGKWSCRQTRCSNGNGICWHVRLGASH